MSNVLVDDVLSGDPEDVEDVEPGEAIVDHHVCEEPDGDGICGASFPTANALRMHKLGKHRDRSADAQPSKAKAATKKSTRRKPAAKKAADTAAQTTTRSEQYAASLAFFAMAAYVAIPPFDDYDLSVVNAGAPNLAAALDEVGDSNQSVRQACDLILGGGAGGAWLKLIMALGSIAMPIAGHHGVIPVGTTAPFNSMVGVPPEPAAAPPSEPAGDAAGDTPTVEDVIAFMSGVPETVMTDAAMRMMQGAGPVVVDVPSSVSATMQGAPHDDERGSEQPSPEPVTVP